MRRAIVAFGLVLVLGLLYTGVTFANGGPHGDYVADGLTDKCAGCHRVHQGLSNGKLLKAETPYALCLTCHNGAGTVLDVLDGVKLSTVGPRTPGQLGLASLNGGGFEYIMGVTVTSKHNANPADNATNPWGYGGTQQGNYAAGGVGQTNSGAGFRSLTAPLQCTQCHNPHGTNNYRLLKVNVNGNATSVKAFYGGLMTNNEGARGLEAGSPSDKYSREYYGSSTSNSSDSFGNFCGSCHTAYPSDGATYGLSAPMTLGGPSTVHYRHRTEMPYSGWINPNTQLPPQNPETNPLLPGVTLRLASNSGQDNTIVTCLTCHRVHGTTATMSGWALEARYGGQTPDGSLTPSQKDDPSMADGVSRSTLLYTNNRGMCEACHQW